jgi:O-methyltransferase
MTIKENLFNKLKKALINSPFKYSERVDSLSHLTLLKDWIENNQPHPYYRYRTELFELVARTIGSDTPISYLEFGVYKGASLSSWIKLNTSDKSEFTGFDSFEGLPEDWMGGGSVTKRGTFSTDNALPVFDDQRVKLVKGWFQDTLPLFLNKFSSDKQIIIHCDADLYSSTMYVLCKMDAHIKQGTIVIFDEFSSMLHEFRALEDYTVSFRRQYEVLGACGLSYYDKVAIRFNK